jgi:VIT1/CCC1 family predicted Fe2+/Mn2+ transporter
MRTAMFKSLRFSNWSTSLKWAIAIVSTIAFLALGGFKLLVVLVISGFMALQVLVQIWLPILAVLVAVTAYGAYRGYKNGTGPGRSALRALSWTLIAGVVVGLLIGLRMAMELSGP